MNCVIVSSKKIMKHSELQGITLPAYFGEMEVLPGHAESFISLEEGEVIFKKTDGQSENVKIKEGECHIKNNNIIIIL